MNKNAIIGVLVAAVVLGGGYLLAKNKPVPVVVETPDVSTPVVPGTPVASTPAVPVAETTAVAGTSSSTAILNGQVKPNGAATTYWFDYGETTAFGTRSAEQSVGSGYGLIPTPTYITGLKANTQYYFRLSAKNRFATVSGATYAFMTNNNPPPQGSAPAVKTGSASSISRTDAKLNGQVDPNNFATTYWFEYGMDMGFGNVTAFQSAGSGTTLDSVSASLSGLAPLTKYYFRLNAQNQYGTTNGAFVSFTTTGPAAPTAPSVSTTAATNIKTTAATFTGRIDPNGAETTYWFEYSSDSLLSSLIGSGTAQKKLAAGTSTVSVTTNVTGLRSATNYYYRIVAQNSQGTVRGEIVSFKTK
jgi:phosphodiesterase/alkaline phosphatase D-like protein